MLDLLFRNGFIVDGTGSPGFTADVGITCGCITIAPKLNELASRIISAEGLVISPGFIDVHSHTDHLVFANPNCESKVTQGITTEVCGNCGESAAPRGGLYSEDIMPDWGVNHGVEVEWHTMEEFLRRLELFPKLINFATLTGHGTIRGMVMGYEHREPTYSEMQLMSQLLIESMEAGSFGLSSGLTYPPGCYAQSRELVNLCQIVSEYGGIYASHIRDEGGGLLSAFAEAIDIGAQSGVSVQLSHHKACGNKAKGLVKESLKMIESARDTGMDVWADQYPYNATCTGIISLLPHWALDGGKECLRRELSDPNTRRTLIDWLIRDASPGGKIYDTGGWESIVINRIFSSEIMRYEGLNIKEISQILGIPPADAMLYILMQDDCNTEIIHFMIDENDIKTVMIHDAVIFGTDSAAGSCKGPLGTGKPHPRSYGAFPRILGRYVRDMQLMTLEKAISKMTGLAAQRLNLKNRGLIHDGYSADLVIFDPLRINDQATYDDPRRFSTGIEAVVVNGKIVYYMGEIMDVDQVHPGKVLRRSPV